MWLHLIGFAQFHVKHQLNKSKSCRLIGLSAQVLVKLPHVNEFHAEPCLTIRFHGAFLKVLFWARYYAWTNVHITVSCETCGIRSKIYCEIIGLSPQCSDNLLLIGMFHVKLRLWIIFFRSPNQMNKVICVLAKGFLAMFHVKPNLKVSRETLLYSGYIPIKTAAQGRNLEFSRH